ncbi:hypothetical protein F511_19252 [Dorcoceras hygrometricum]|uniref:Uncharacterized protein n=1 Tax=Dorcoceras hygrometricum TaxID=472368 RepID=A0A2Z7CNP4_9LAMI|nr:hypothetical protein F511_19252 [Dorcoceras hygrometricum]
MSSSTESVVRSVANSIDSIPGSPEVVGHLLHQEEGGMFDKFEVVLPGPEERAHRPPRGFHTFYINQLEMGLRFPLPRFIAALCQHIKMPEPTGPQLLQLTPSLGRTPSLLQSSPCPLRPHATGPDERMGKAEMLRALEEAEAASSGAAALPTKATKKRKASTTAEKEARRQRKKKGASTSETRPGLGRRGDKTPHPSPARGRRPPPELRRHIRALIELEMRLAEVEAARAEEARAVETHLAALETQGLRLEAEKAALMQSEVVERLVEVSVKLLVYEDFWRNLIERSLIVVRFWIFSSREPLSCLRSQERSGCLGRELQRLVRTLLRCVVPEKSDAIIGVVNAGVKRLPPSCDGLTGSEDHRPMISPVDTPCGYRG